MSYQGRHSSQTVIEKNTGKHTRLNLIPILIIVLSCALLATIGATVAYLVSRPTDVENIFKPAHVDGEVVEEVDSGIKKSVKIKSTSDVDAFIRAAVVANKIDENGDVLGSADVSSHFCGDKWTKNGNYYYYNGLVKPEENTTELLTSEIDLEGIQVTILAEAVQAEPFTPEGYGKPAYEAWGIQIHSDGTLTAG